MRAGTTVKVEIAVNKVNALKAAEALAPESVAYGDDACAIRCAAAWDVLGGDAVARARAAFPALYLLTPQLLAGAAEVRCFAERAADLVEAGFSGIIVNNLGLLEALRRARPGLAERTRLIAGRRLNTYNSRDLAMLARMGFVRATANIELTADGIAALRPPPGLALSLFGYGAQSLAYSRMCYLMSLKGEVDYQSCGIACEKEGLDLGAESEDPVFRLYGREILSSRRFCAARALARLGGRIDVLEVGLPHADALPELRTAIALLRDAAAGSLDEAALTVREAELQAATRFGLCNGSLFGLPGAAYARTPTPASDSNRREIA